MNDFPKIQAKEWLISVGNLLSVGTKLDGSDWGRVYYVNSISGFLCWLLRFKSIEIVFQTNSRLERSSISQRLLRRWLWLFCCCFKNDNIWWRYLWRSNLRRFQYLCLRNLMRWCINVLLRFRLNVSLKCRLIRGVVMKLIKLLIWLVLVICSIGKELRWVLWWDLISNLNVVRQRSNSSEDHTNNPVARCKVLAHENRLSNCELPILSSAIMILNWSTLLLQNLSLHLRFQQMQRSSNFTSKNQLGRTASCSRVRNLSITLKKLKEFSLKIYFVFNLRP